MSKVQSQPAPEGRKRVAGGLRPREVVGDRLPHESEPNARFVWARLAEPRLEAEGRQLRCTSDFGRRTSYFRPWTLDLGLWTFVVWLTFGTAGWAQDVRVRATVSSDVVEVQDQFQFTITISGPDGADAENPRVRLQDFQVVSGPNVSTQFEWINGRTSGSKSISYILLPRREGHFTIEAAEVSVRGKVFRTEPVRVRVTASPNRPPAQSRTPGVDPFGVEPRSSGNRIAPSDVLVTAELDRPWAYPGQQVTLLYHLYTRVGVSGLQLQENPSLNGFWVEDLNVESNPPGNRKSLDGVEYLEYVVKKQALFPTATGRVSVPPATFAISVKSPGDFFGFFSGAETVYRRTREISLEVRPLPAEDRPQGFAGAVGSFNLVSRLDKPKASTGEAISLQVRLEGRGNLKMIPDLALPTLPEFTVFSSKRTENVRPFEEGIIGGDRTWEYVIVPKAPGLQSIPSLSFSYFDPQKGRYEILTTPALSVSVERGAENASSAGGLSGVVKQDLTRQGADINFIKVSAGNLQPERKPFYLSSWFYLLAAIPLAFNIAVLLYQRERARQPSLTRSRKARRLAVTRLKNALKAGKREPRLFYDQAALAFSGYLADKFGVPEIAVTGDSLERMLSEKSIASEAVKETISCLQECDFGRFVSASSSGEKMRSLAGRIDKAIGLLERAG